MSNLDFKDYLEGPGSENLSFEYNREMVLDNYSLKDVNLEIPDEDERRMEVDTRNKRWFHILENWDVEKQRLCCVGIGHLNGLFKLFEGAGYKVEWLGDD